MYLYCHLITVHHTTIVDTKFMGWMHLLLLDFDEFKEEKLLKHSLNSGIMHLRNKSFAKY